MAATRRDCFFATIKREREGYIPYYFTLSPAQLRRFEARTGTRDYAEYYDMPIRFVPLSNKPRDVDFMRYYGTLPPDTTIDHWGVAHEKGSVEHFTRMHHPMEGLETLEEFQAFPYPSVERDFDWEGIRQPIEIAKQRDLITYSAPGMLGPTIFEIAWYLRGMELFMMDMIAEPELVEYHLDRITAIRIEGARRYAAAGVDVIRLGDDVGTQKDMMISPELYRTYLKPRMKKIIDAAREVKPDVLIDYHSDGNIMSVIPDLIEIGVDILNPVQPECMDPFEVKERYGDLLSFNGTLGTQTVLPFGTPDEVERTCRELIEKVGKGGGLILAPTHIVEPEVPWENVETYLAVVRKNNAAHGIGHETLRP